MKSTNPFDDSPRASTGGSGAGTNPFDDNNNEDENPNADLKNNYHNNNNATAALNTASMSHTSGSIVEPSSIMAGGPSESAWQDLGDLPYRRVHLYSNVSWGCTPAQKMNKSR